MTTEYETNFLQQKLYQLNVIHDMDHDFSTQKFSDRLGKIGKRIHNTAIALGALPTNTQMIHSGGAPGDVIDNTSSVISVSDIRENSHLFQLGEDYFVKTYLISKEKANYIYEEDDDGSQTPLTKESFIQNIIEMESQCDNDILKGCFCCQDDSQNKSQKGPTLPFPTNLH